MFDCDVVTKFLSSFLSFNAELLSCEFYFRVNSCWVCDLLPQFVSCSLQFAIWMFLSFQVGSIVFGLSQSLSVEFRPSWVVLLGHVLHDWLLTLFRKKTKLISFLICWAEILVRIVGLIVCWLCQISRFSFGLLFPFRRSVMLLYKY